MFWNNQRRTTNMFLWGTIAGAIAGIYASRRLMQNPTRQRSSEHAQSEQKMNGFNKMEETNKIDLFDTFMNGTESELEQKASEMNFKN